MFHRLMNCSRSSEVKSLVVIGGGDTVATAGSRTVPGCVASQLYGAAHTQLEQFNTNSPITLTSMKSIPASKSGGTIKSDPVKVPDNRKDDQVSPSVKPFRFSTSLIIVLSLAVCAFSIYISWWILESPKAAKSNADRFMEWLKENGALIDGVKIAGNIDGNERDLVSTRPIYEGDAVAVLPRELMISKNVYDNDPDVQEAVDRVEDMDDTSRLAVFLVTNRDSFWTPFIQILPSSIPMPIFWDQADLAYLQIPRFLEEINATNTYLHDTYDLIEEVIPDISFPEYKLAWAQVASRAWGVALDQVDQSVLLPLFDMADHEPQGVSVHFDEDLGTASIIANRDHIGLSLPIHTYYHNSSNFVFLSSYGFTLTGNDHHLLCRLSIDDGSGNLVRKELTASFDDDDFQNLMTELRQSDAELSEFQKELGALETISEAASEQLNEFSTTIEDDDKLLQTNLTLNQINAVRSRRHEKLCLSRYKDLHSMVTDAVGKGDWSEFQESYGLWSGADEYITNLQAMDHKV